MKPSRKIVALSLLLLSPLYAREFHVATTGDDSSDGKIIIQTAEALLKQKEWDKTPTRTGLLGLMATGEKKYIDLVGKAIHDNGLLAIDAKAVDEYLTGKGAHVFGPCGWMWGYDLITLGEYYLLTKDETVMPAIRIHANALACGQDGGVG